MKTTISHHPIPIKMAITKKWKIGPGQIVQLVRASSQYTKVAGLIPGQSTSENQPMNELVSGATN